MNIVKKSFHLIQDAIKHTFNLSLQQGIFPKMMKIAKVLPVYKSGDETNPSNYRPISILPCFSKILERIMYNRLFSYLKENEILYKKKFGFEARNSTDHAIIHLVDEILQAFNENKYTLGVFIDLSKAFDTVDHQILLSKLENYGIEKQNLKWFQDYLSSRYQYIEYDLKQTELSEITCGVPQGSILGPLLFLIYINDLHSFSKIIKSILFADDTNLFFSHSNVKTLFKTVNEELVKIDEWFKANKLSLNIDKTQYSLS